MWRLVLSITMVIIQPTNVSRLVHQGHSQTTKLRNVWQFAQKTKMFMVILYFMSVPLLAQADALAVK